jgi:hypothetical protein
MSRMALPCLLVAVLLVLSGCNAFTDRVTDPAETPTLTPASVPTDELTSTPVAQIAPGLTKYGLINGSTLVNAHTAFLRNTSYTVRKAWILKSPNGTVVARRVDITRVEGSRIYSTGESTGMPGQARHVTYETWYGEKRGFTRRTYNNSTSYTRIPHTGLSYNETIPVPGPSFYHAFESWRNPVIERLSRDGTTLYRLKETYRNDPANITIYARIDTRGVIHNYTVRKPISFPPVPDASLSIKSIQVTNISATTVERPAWYAEAINTTTPVNNTNTITPTNNTSTTTITND